MQKEKVSVSDLFYRHQNRIRAEELSEKEAMGRRKVEIKRIENKSRRQITFCKRRNGLMEKARQLSILCGSSVALFIVSATGKLYSFSSGDSIAKILSHYEIKHADDLKTLRETGIEVLALESLRRGCKLCGTPNLVLKGSCRKNSELSFAQGVQCDLEEANVSINCLMSLEEQLKIALSLTKARKFDTILNALLQTKLMVELVKTFQEKEKLLREENQVLASQMGKNKMKKFRETEDDRDMSPGNSSGNTSPETLPLLK